MRKTIIALTIASALALGACQSKQADQVEDQAEAQSDAIDAQADAMPEGPAKEATEAKADAVEDAGEFVKLSVKDDGEGMPEEVLANCRRPFYSTKGESGTGMGLAMAANVLEAHGGKLEIQSSPGQGTEVSLLLPQAPA